LLIELRGEEEWGTGQSSKVSSPASMIAWWHLIFQ